MTGLKKLELARIENELPPMTSPDNVMVRLEIVQNWACAGLIPGTVAGAVVRAADVWYKVHDLKLDRERTRQLEQRVKELQGQLDGHTPLRRA